MTGRLRLKSSDDGHSVPLSCAGVCDELNTAAAGMIEANKGFRRLKAHKQLSVLRAALQAHHDRVTIKPSRRLAKDWEASVTSAEVWRLIVSTRQLVRRIARSANITS